MIDPVADLYWAALSTKHTVRASYAAARYAVDMHVPGDFVECGVFAGVQAAAMARALMGYREITRKVHLFDSFNGVPAAGPNDVGWTHPQGVSKCSKQEMLGYMGMWKIPQDLLVIHEGDFADTIPHAKGPIAVLRVDADLYESTLICMKYLYPLVSSGGWIIVDDWDLPGARKAVMETVSEFGPVYFQKHG